MNRCFCIYSNSQESTDLWCKCDNECKINSITTSTVKDHHWWIHIVSRLDWISPNSNNEFLLGQGEWGGWPDTRQPGHTHLPGLWCALETMFSITISVSLSFSCSWANSKSAGGRQREGRSIIAWAQRNRRTDEISPGTKIYCVKTYSCRFYSLGVLRLILLCGSFKGSNPGQNNLHDFISHYVNVAEINVSHRDLRDLQKCFYQWKAQVLNTWSSSVKHDHKIYLNLNSPIFAVGPDFSSTFTPKHQ